MKYVDVDGLQSALHIFEQRRAILKPMTGNSTKRFLPRGTTEWISAAAFLIFLLLFIYFQLLTIHSQQNWVRIPGYGSIQTGCWHPVINNNDFKHIFLGAALVKGDVPPFAKRTLTNNPYDVKNLFAAKEAFRIEGGLNPYVYPPFNAISLRWLVSTGEKDSFEWGWRKWNAVQYILIAGILILVFLMHPENRFLRLAAATGILAFSFPLTRHLTAGQLNLVQLFIYFAAFHFLVLGMKKSAAFIAAFGAWFKIAPGILLIFFALSRRWKTALTFIIFALIFLGVAIGVAGLQLHLDYLPYLRDMGYGKSTWSQLGMSFYDDLTNLSINSFLHHALNENPETTPWINAGANIANGLTWIISLALLGLTGWLTWHYSDKKNTDKFDQRDRLIFSLWIFMSLLMPSLMWDHYVVQLLICQLILLQAMLGMPRGWKLWTGLGVWLAATLLINWMYPFAATKYDPNLQEWFLHFLSRLGVTEYRQGFGIILLSHKLFAALMLFGLNVVLLVSWSEKVEPSKAEI